MTKLIIILPLEQPHRKPPIQAQHFVFNKTYGLHIYKNTEYTPIEFNAIIDKVMSQEYDWVRPSVRAVAVEIAEPVTEPPLPPEPEEWEPEVPYKDLQAQVSDDLNEPELPNFESPKRRPGRPRKIPLESY